jgi:predicted transcriptional regulator YdeE
VQPEFVTETEIRFIGQAVRTSNQAESNPSSARIPGLWGRFFAENIPGSIPFESEPTTILGVYTNYESDDTGEYSLIAACRVSSLDNLPDGMTGGIIPAADYLVFQAKGQMPQALIATWGSVWNYFSAPRPYRRSFTTDFELYKGGNEADIYIAVTSNA